MESRMLPKRSFHPRLLFCTSVKRRLAFPPQIRDAEQMHGTCADRERRLQRLCRWIEQQQKQLDQSQQPTCQTVAHKTLLELEVQYSERMFCLPFLLLTPPDLTPFPLSSRLLEAECVRWLQHCRSWKRRECTLERERLTLAIYCSPLRQTLFVTLVGIWGSR